MRSSSAPTVAVRAIEHGKHLVLVNAELDSTLGTDPQGARRRAGVVLTDMAGDQPAVLMNLVREVADCSGSRPILAGNIKSLLDHYRTPETQKAFAEAVFQRPKMITSFADGTKIAAEMAIVGQRDRLRRQRPRHGRPGVRARRGGRRRSSTSRRSSSGPIVDYILGAEPSFGVFVLGYSEDPLDQRYMKFYKMGDGPVYTFYRPFHLGPLETPLTIARAALFGDAALAPLGAPTCDVIALAKRDLRAGETLDGVGGFTCYGDASRTRRSPAGTTSCRWASPTAAC